MVASVDFVYFVTNELCRCETFSFFPDKPPHASRFDGENAKLQCPVRIILCAACVRICRINAVGEREKALPEAFPS